MSRAIVVLVALSLIGFPLFAQQIEIRGGVQGGVIGFPGMPARDRNAPPATGTSRIRGRVLGRRFRPAAAEGAGAHFRPRDSREPRLDDRHQAVTSSGTCRPADIR
jgi:hypothetical protein